MTIYKLFLPDKTSLLLMGSLYFFSSSYVAYSKVTTLNSSMRASGNDDEVERNYCFEDLFSSYTRWFLGLLLQVEGDFDENFSIYKVRLKRLLTQLSVFYISYRRM